MCEAFSRIYSERNRLKDLVCRCSDAQQTANYPGRYGKRCPQPCPTPERYLQSGPSWKRHNPQCAAKSFDRSPCSSFPSIGPTLAMLWCRTTTGNTFWMRWTGREPNSPPYYMGLRSYEDSFSWTFPIMYLMKRRRSWLLFVMRFQQFTGPVMAKGVEDTTHYVYNRLLSLNEVGGRPDHFGCSLEEFHNFNTKRRNLWPDSLNATSTHDTKRGEDVRARINVLSEMPDEWLRKIRTWIKINRGKKKRVRGSSRSG